VADTSAAEDVQAEAWGAYKAAAAGAEAAARTALALEKRRLYRTRSDTLHGIEEWGVSRSSVWFFGRILTSSSFFST
jgi:hypothetical protein